MIDRRSFLAAASTLALGAGCRPGDGRDAPSAGGASAAPNGEGAASTPSEESRASGGSAASAGYGVGVQVYTLREAMDRDPAGTLAAVAAMGYREVELFQLHGLTPRQMREALDAAGLRATSSHYGLPYLREELDRAVDGALEIGQAFMIVPSIDGDERGPEGLRRAADDFDRIGDRVRSAGMRFGYHNHDWEFQAAPDGTLPMSLLLDRTDPELVDWEMDIFWAVHGGGDPLALLGERAGRVTTVHVKDRTPDGSMVDVGDGVIDFATILGAAEGQGLRHAYVEHDRPSDPLESVRRGYEHLQAIGVVT